MDRIKSSVMNIDIDCAVSASLNLDEVTNTKILTISSPTTFINETNDSLTIRIVEKGQEPVNIELKKYLGPN
jgi:hypothetical protein